MKQAVNFFTITFCILFFAQDNLAAQTVTTLSKKSPVALRSDFKLMRDTLQKIHPAAYRFKSKSAVNHIFDSCYKSIHDSMTVPQFYLLTNFVMATIGDGHANCRLPNQVIDDYRARVKVFPAMVMFLHNKAFVFCCNQNTALNGTEIISINGRPMNEIVRRLFAYIATDGNIESRKNWELPEMFHILYNLVYGETTKYAVTYRTLKGEIKEVKMDADLMKNILCPSPFNRPARYLTLRYMEDHIAILTISSFFDGFLKQTGENFKRFLDSAFTDIAKKKITKLIIDGRRNQGGNDHNGEILYSYLTDKPFMYYASQETVHEKFTANERSDIAIQQPNEKNYSGKVYFLMDGRSFSATAEFSSIARTNNRGLFIGEEIGGGYYGNSSGDEAMVVLPATQISCRIPLIKYTLAVKKSKYTDRGVLPDFPVYPSITDFISHTDSQMDRAVQLVREH